MSETAGLPPPSDPSLREGPSAGAVWAEWAKSLGGRAGRRLLAVAEGVFLNPVMVKELQATVRRARFVLVLSVAVAIVSAVVSLVYLLIEANASAGNPGVLGRTIFGWFIIVMLPITSLIFPAFSCTQIIEERQTKSWDLLVTTTLEPWQIVLGKFQASMTLSTLFAAAAMPLVTISIVVGGVAPAQVFWFFVATVAYAWLISCHTLFISAASASATRAIIGAYVSIFLLGGFLYGPLLYWFLVAAFGDLWGLEPDFRIYAGDGPPEEVRTLLGIGTMGLAILLGTYFLAAATNRLKPPVANHSTNLRLIYAATLGLGFFVFQGVVRYAYDVAASGPGRAGFAGEVLGWGAVVAAFVILGVATIGAIAFGSEAPLPPESLHRALEARRARVRRPVRERLLWLLRPGGLSAGVYVILTGALAAGAVYLLVRGMAGPLLILRTTFLTVLSAGFLAVLFTAHLALFFTIVIRNETASKVLAFVVLLALSVVPGMLYTIEAESIWSDDSFTRSQAIIASAGYLSPIVVFWGLIEGTAAAYLFYPIYGLATAGLAAFNVTAIARETARRRQAWSERAPAAEAEPAPAGTPGAALRLGSGEASVAGHPAAGVE